VEPAGKAHAFVDDLTTPVIDVADRHHLERVLRLRAGDEITVSDGRGGWRLCRLGDDIEPVGDVQQDERPDPESTIAFALVKGERPELVVQKLTEVGVDRIVPFVAERSVVRWDATKRTRQHERLTSVAREAAMQSRRAWLPVVEPVCAFDDVATRPDAALAERLGRPPTLTFPTVLVGPEGGWTERERAANERTIGLGPNVLRAETAAISAGVLMCGLRSARFGGNDGRGG